VVRFQLFTECGFSFLLVQLSALWHHPQSGPVVVKSSTVCSIYMHVGYKHTLLITQSHLSLCYVSGSQLRSISTSHICTIQL